jgi:hypothetical protein
MKITPMIKRLTIAGILIVIAFIAFSFQKAKPTNRFFLISYSIQTTNGGTSIGDFPCEVSGFPSKVRIVEKVSEFSGQPATHKTVVVTNIFEFKSKQDYLDYNYSK